MQRLMSPQWRIQMEREGLMKIYKSLIEFNIKF